MKKPAILGGIPENNTIFPPYNTIGEDEKNAVMAVLDSGELSGFVAGNIPAFFGGKQVQALEKEFCKQFDVKYAVSVNSATSGLYCMLMAMGIGPGDEVLTTAHSWISTSETISQTGAKPVFIDTNEFYCLDETLIEEKINSKTKAIVPVHLYGHPCDMTTLSKLSKKYKIFIVEDCAQAIMTKWSNKFVGTYGDAGTLSFFPGKNLGSPGKKI